MKKILSSSDKVIACSDFDTELTILLLYVGLFLCKTFGTNKKIFYNLI